MSNIVLAAGGDDGYQISRSVRLRSSASGYFSKTFGSAGNRKKWTYSAWIKRGTLGTYGGLIASKVDGNNYSSLEFSGDELRFVQAVGGSITVNKKPAAVFRDPSAWYHIIAVMDTDNATAEDRFILYVNGVRVTTWASNTPPALGLATGYINSTTAQWIGLDANPLYFDGYLADVNFIDGMALTASSFGEIDPLTGVWKPKAYGGSRGTNGFYLNFSDNSAATAAAIGKDSSGNGNNWTPNNISVTAGVTYDSMLDVPTMRADGGNGRGNYAVLNNLDATSGVTDAEGNLKWTAGSPYNTANRATISVSSGKWYWEVTPSGTYGNYAWIGVADSTSAITNVGRSTANGWYYAGINGNKYNGSAVAYGATFGSGDVIGVALDMDAGTLTFYKNNTSQGTAFSSGLSGKTLSPALHDGAADLSAYVNFGQRPFAYTPPTGFKALNTQNLPDATIKKGGSYFNTVLYTGNSSTQSITGVGFQPDLLWIKGRSASGYDNVLQDVVRGSTYQLYSNTTDAEVNDVDAVTAFNTDGFALGADVTVNNSGVTFVGWNWKESASAGFDIVTYTGNGGASQNISHSLGVAPAMMIVKPRSAADNWRNYHKMVNGGVNPANYSMSLNSTAAQTANSTIWNNTAPTSSVFTVGSDSGVNGNGTTFVAYLFAEVAGFSKFGSYTGNGSADGPFVYCGFRPRYVLYKRSDSTGDWYVWDTARDTVNVAGNGLFPNYSVAESAYGTILDILSNGFKLRTNGVVGNSSGATYIYAAFAENPFKNSLAR